MISPVKLWRRQKHIPDLLGRKGKIVSWTIVRTPPAGFSRYAPYVAALIELNSGDRITGQIVDVQIEGAEKVSPKIKSGQKVIAVLRKVREPDKEGVIPYGIKFKLVKNKEEKVNISNEL